MHLFLIVVASAVVAAPSHIVPWVSYSTLSIRSPIQNDARVLLVHVWMRGVHSPSVTTIYGHVWVDDAAQHTIGTDRSNLLSMPHDLGFWRPHLRIHPPDVTHESAPVHFYHMAGRPAERDRPWPFNATLVGRHSSIMVRQSGLQGGVRGPKRRSPHPKTHACVGS